MFVDVAVVMVVIVVVCVCVCYVACVLLLVSEHMAADVVACRVMWYATVQYRGNSCCSLECYTIVCYSIV